MDKPVVEVETSIAADPKAIWKLMTAKRSPMFLGSTVETDWEPGHGLTLKGEWQGKSFTDYGEIESAEEGRELSFTHWSKTPKRPESYHLVRYRLEPDGKKTRVSLAQFNKGRNTAIDAKTKAEFEKTWTMMLDSLKQAAEQKH
jgi:uncharacterized protein YndB with AHSA1/START domain